MSRVYIPLAPCDHAVNVNCPETGRKCEKCCWNPVVTARRKKAIRKEMEGKA